MVYESEPTHRRELEIDGFPAREEEITEPILIYQYVLELRAGEECSDAAVLAIRTEGQAAGDYDANKMMVRRLAQGLDVQPGD